MNFSKDAISSIAAWLTPDLEELTMLMSGMLSEFVWLDLLDSELTCLGLFVNLQQFRKHFARHYTEIRSF